MSALRTTLLITLMVFFTASCSVISPQIREESKPSVPFKTLVQETDKYVGKTVILGGYILETHHWNGNTLITVLQTPLTLQDKPKSRSDAEGRFIVVQKGLLARDMYTADREITVAGTVVGPADEKSEGCPSPCLKIQSREIYLWSEAESRDYTFGYSDINYWDTPFHRSWY